MSAREWEVMGKGASGNHAHRGESEQKEEGRWGCAVCEWGAGGGREQKDAGAEES